MRAGTIVRVWRADSFSGRPLKLIVRSRKFQNDVSEEADARFHGLGFPLPPSFWSCVRGKQVRSPCTCSSVPQVPLSLPCLPSKPRRAPNTGWPKHRYSSAPRSASFGAWGALVLLSRVPVERVVPRAQSGLVRRALTTAWNGR
jgi:hypothetical protein